MGGRSLYTLLYVAATAICVGISVYLSYFGYYSHLQELAGLFAVLLGILLFGTDMLLRRFRLAGRSLVKPLLFFAVVAAFSGASNYNFLYTNFMADDLAERVVTEQFATFRSNLVETRRALQASPAVAEVRQQRQALERALENLRVQVNDPLRPGCGERCRSHVSTIYERLGGPPTELAIPAVDASAERTARWYENFRRAVVQDFENGHIPEGYHRARALIAEIDEQLERYDDPYEALAEARERRGRALVEDRDYAVIGELRNRSQAVERRANALLPAGSEVRHAAITSDLDKLGEIPISLRDGLIERPNSGVTAISLILAVFVDIAPVLFAGVVFSPVAAGAAPAGGAEGRGPSRVATR